MSRLINYLQEEMIICQSCQGLSTDQYLGVELNVPPGFRVRTGPSAGRKMAT